MRQFSALLKSALFLSIACMPAIASAAFDGYRSSNDMNRPGMTSDQRDMHDNQMDSNNSQRMMNGQPQYMNTPNSPGQNSYSRGNWNYPQTVSRAGQNQMYFDQSELNDRQYTSGPHRGWDSSRTYSNSQSGDARYFPAHSYYTGIDSNRDGRIDGMERRNGQYWSSNYYNPSYGSSHYGYDNYSNPSYGYDNSYPYSQSYDNDYQGGYYYQTR